ncbi:regulatory protein RecX [Fulvivirga ligni]|uniref:regulatory protein RecX n=1 Tax=Fulvivirga ligni TaxID=2904246 RepID=UPI001F22EF54|nr:regulatory protein RecX [Fulvivirga ligni]UII22767.1 RecX family transcriptional regulator [Fulvivirga ligni]
MEYNEHNKKPRRTFTMKEAKVKAADFCAYQERTQQQVRDKLYEYGLYQDEVENVLTDLITDGFINEERFAKSYVGGKFRMKKWGRVKIMQGLKQHRLSDYCIKKGMEEIEESDYLEALHHIIDKKDAALSETNMFIRKRKIANHAIQKGYEAELVWDILRDMA